ncbi:MAG: ABC transporter permease [Tissierellia bacterium]|nr:ABC transporter permease [Tissierellia bacterium]
MKRAISLELYRLRKNKYPWIIIIISSIMIIGSVFMTTADFNYYINNKGALEELKQTFEQVNWGIYIGSVIPKWCDIGYIPITELFMRNIQSKILLMFQTIFVILYIGEEIKTSFLKNLASAFPKKIELIFGKLVTIAIFCFMIFLINFLVMSLSFYIMEGYLRFDNIGLFIKYILTEYLLYLSFSVIIMLLAYLIRNSAVTLLVGLLESAGILQIVDSIVHNISNGSSFSIMNYLVSGNIVLLSIESSDDLYIRSLIIALIYLFVSIFASFIIFNKKDIY